MNVAGKRVLVLGAARSGIACAKFLAAHGATVALSDAKPIEKWSSEALALKSNGVGLVPGEVPGWLLDNVDLVVISPGVPTKAVPLRYAERAGAEVIGEVELASRYLKGRIVAITGTNGKTTTTSLIGELLKDAGVPAQVGGNIGRPLISLVENSRDDGWTVVELSSFQLETIKEFHPTVAVVLNVTPNHMDRYESFTAYAAAKHRIFMNQGPGDVAILNADDEIISRWASGLRAQVVRFSVKQQLEEGLLLGGRGKKAPYSPLAPLLMKEARKLILIGEDAETIANELGDYASFERATDMKDAVTLAFQAAQPGDIVLLAPACASFDMFDSFEHRGRVFKDAVSSLESRVSSSPVDQESATNAGERKTKSEFESRNSKPN